MRWAAAAARSARRIRSLAHTLSLAEEPSQPDGEAKRAARGTEPEEAQSEDRTSLSDEAEFPGDFQEILPSRRRGAVTEEIVFLGYAQSSECDGWRGSHDQASLGRSSSVV